jgi:hypothetical protein
MQHRTRDVLIRQRTQIINGGAESSSGFATDRMGAIDELAAMSAEQRIARLRAMADRVFGTVHRIKREVAAATLPHIT